MQTFEYSKDGLALTESFEGLRLMAYQDVAGVWTVGYGHTGIGVRSGLVITQAEAQILLQSDIAASAACVNSLEPTLPPARQPQGQHSVRSSTDSESVPRCREPGSKPLARPTQH